MSDPEATGKTVAISQSNYIPWKGYFDQIHQVDHFVLFDDVQYTRRDWRNRNRIKTPQGLQWLSIPIEVKRKYEQKIHEARVADASWADSHWRCVERNYRRSPYFSEFADPIKSWYRQARDLVYLSEINYLFISKICQLLGVSSTIGWSMDYERVNGQSQRLLRICEQAGASTYLSGPAAREYLDEPLFTGKGINVKWMDYSGYPQYPQLHGEFEHSVSALDVIFSCGPHAADVIWGWRREHHVRPANT